MNKTLLKGFTEKTYKAAAVEDDTKNSGEALVSLMHEMKGYLQQAAEELLQPRPEAVAGILTKYKAEDTRRHK